MISNGSKIFSKVFNRAGKAVKVLMRRNKIWLDFVQKHLTVSRHVRNKRRIKGVAKMAEVN